MPVPEVFVDLDSVVFIQEDGPCTGYLAMPCHAIDSTSIARTEAARVYCKSQGQRGARVVARTVPGVKEAGTLTINARSQKQSDLLHRIWQKNCLFGAQTHLDVCGLPTDPTAYTKILDYYGIVPGGLDYSNIDNLEGGEGTALQVALSCTYDDLVEVLKIVLERIPAVTIADLGSCRSIYGSLEDRCSPDPCGDPQDPCDIVVAYIQLTAAAPSTCRYTTDNGATWGTTAVVPLLGLNNALTASCIIGSRWIGFATAIAAGYDGLCTYTDNSGGAWTMVDMSGTAGGADFVTGCYLHDAGNLWACGGEATPAGHVWFSSDRGATWTVFDTICAQILQDIATADGNTVYAVGNADTVMKTENAGVTWTALTGPANGTYTLQAVRALTNDHVLVGGWLDDDNEQLWCSLDGGATWTAQIFDGSTTANSGVGALSLAPNAPMQHVWMTQCDSAGSVATYPFRSLDGGHDWERWTLDNDGLSDIFACDSNHAWIGGFADAAEGGTATIIRADPVT